MKKDYCEVKVTMMDLTEEMGERYTVTFPKDPSTMSVESIEYHLEETLFKFYYEDLEYEYFEVMEFSQNDLADGLVFDNRCH